MCRLEVLAGLGLLDGLLEELDDDETRGEGGDGGDGRGRGKGAAGVAPAEIARLQSLNESYEQILERQEVRKAVLLSALDDLAPNQALDSPLHPAIIPNIERLARISSHDFVHLVANIDALFRDLQNHIDKSLRSILCPLDNSDAVHSVLRHQSVDSRHLTIRAWHPEDYAFYLQKLQSGVESLQQFGLYLSLDALLEGERRVSHIRSLTQATIVDDLCSLRIDLLSLRAIMTRSLERHVQWLREIIANLETCRNTVRRQLHPVLEFTSAECPPDPASLSIPKTSRDRHPEIEPLQERVAAIARSLHTSKDIARRLIGADAELEVVPAGVRSSEEVLRSCSMALSNALMNVQTESGRVRLLLAERPLRAHNRGPRKE